LTPDEFFSGTLLPRQLFALVLREVEALGKVDVRTTRSQVAFRRRRAFAWVWMPGQYLTGRTAPLVLSISLPGRDGSVRWKEVVEPIPGRFMHHLELNDEPDVDDDVRIWLRQAWEAAA
jgi:hypothetical protein